MILLTDGMIVLVFLAGIAFFSASMFNRLRGLRLEINSMRRDLLEVMDGNLIYIGDHVDDHTGGGSAGQPDGRRGLYFSGLGYAKPDGEEHAGYPGLLRSRNAK